VSADIPSKSVVPKEAPEGGMRAWLEILRERHPGVLWVAAEQTEQTRAARLSQTVTQQH
jgi:hypothetical protein